MSGETTQAELDARMLRELREWRRSPSVEREIARGRQVWLDPDELDLLLRIADERDELKRRDCEMPDERSVEIPPGHALVKGELVEIPSIRWPASMIAAHGHGPNDPREGCPICDPSVIA